MTGSIAGQVAERQLAASVARVVADLAARGSVLVAYSGGVDSALVAALAVRALGDRALAVTAAAETLAGAELDHARRLAAEIGIRHEVITYSELDDPEFVANPAHRCYVCQGMRMDAMWREAAARAAWPWSATAPTPPTLAPIGPACAPCANAACARRSSPMASTRPAARAMARALGLSAWDRPANACLSSRIPHGQLVTLGKLRRIEAAEALLAARGLPRWCACATIAGAARVEVGAGRGASAWRRCGTTSRRACARWGSSAPPSTRGGYRRGGADARPPTPPGPPSLNPAPRAPAELLDERRRPCRRAGGARRRRSRDLAELPFADLGFAKLDLHRELRVGLPEAVYAEGKTQRRPAADRRRTCSRRTAGCW